MASTNGERYHDALEVATWALELIGQGQGDREEAARTAAYCQWVLLGCPEIVDYVAAAERSRATRVAVTTNYRGEKVLLYPDGVVEELDETKRRPVAVTAERQEARGLPANPTEEVCHRTAELR